VVYLCNLNFLSIGFLIKMISPKTRLILFANGIEVWGPLSVIRKKMLKHCDQVLAVSEFTKRTILQQYQLPDDAYSCLLSSDKKELYISVWGARKVVVFNTVSQTISGEIQVQENPNELLLSGNGKVLYVANAGDNSVSVIDITTKKVIEVLHTALYPDAPTGSSSNGLALSQDEKTLYVANADKNRLSFFDVS